MNIHKKEVNILTLQCKFCGTTLALISNSNNRISIGCMNCSAKPVITVNKTQTIENVYSLLFYYELCNTDKGIEETMNRAKNSLIKPNIDIAQN